MHLPSLTTMYYSLLIAFGVLTYIFLAGVTFVSTRISFFASVSWDKDYSYEECERRQEAGASEHIIALLWPVLWVVTSIVYLVYFVERLVRYLIRKVKRK